MSAAVAGLIFARVISILVSAYYVRNDIKIWGFIFVIKPLNDSFFGGWMTVSNIISPVMVYFNRFIVSNIMGQKVAFYSAPAEVILKLGIIPAAIGRAVFPRLSNIKDFKEFKRNVNKSLLLMFLICLPVIIIGLLYSGLVLKIWFGENYKINSFNILNVLLIGFFFNALAMIPFSAIRH
ncbi:oligosaccharide flippase family protein [Shigella flexneri]